MSTIPWKRVRKGLAQFAREHGFKTSAVARVMHVLHQVLALCGNESQSRKAVYRIGCALLHQPVHLFVPVCPDYLYEVDTFTYRGMGQGIPPLFHRHKVFLDQVVKLIPDANVTIMLADHEGEPEELRRVLHVSKEEFRRNMKGSFAAIARVCPKPWKLIMFTDLFPCFIEQTWKRAQELLRDPFMKRSIVWEASLRTALHDHIGYAQERRLEITAHAVAQYLATGEAIARQGGLICNHTTTSLKWYQPTQVAVLHNPVKSV